MYIFIIVVQRYVTYPYAGNIGDQILFTLGITVFKLQFTFFR